MGDPVSVTDRPRTRPSVPGNFGQYCFVTEQSPGRKFTVHSNGSDYIFTQMLLLNSKPKSQTLGGWLDSRRTATSRINFWPAFSVSKALRIGGSASVSNFTIRKRLASANNCAFRGPSLATEAQAFPQAFGVPSTTAPMTWCIFPSPTPLANRAPRAGAAFLLMGWKARRAPVGRANTEARRVRARPLYPNHPCQRRH